MVLLSGAMRAAALTGRREPVDQWLAGRQLGFWAGQWGRPVPPRPPDGGALASLQDLHDRGVIDDAELATLRRRAGA
jgi:hypothetical protein